MSYLDQGASQRDERETSQHPEPEGWEVLQFGMNVVHFQCR